MDDLISRQAAIEELERMVKTHEHDRFGGELFHWTGVKAMLDLLPSAQPQWIPCSERLPERIINGDVETVQEFFVTVKERWPGEEWKYHTDVAEFPGDYIDDVWQTYNDWKEGQEVHVIAWMPLPEPYKEKP